MDQCSLSRGDTLVLISHEDVSGDNVLFRQLLPLAMHHRDSAIPVLLVEVICIQ